MTRSCTDCYRAKWFRTDVGRLHPSGDGKCEWEYPVTEIPKAFYWHYHTPPTPSGGRINRKKPYENCGLWVKKP